MQIYKLCCLDGLSGLSCIYKLNELWEELTHDS
jgi:hypothetical protein